LLACGPAGATPPRRRAAARPGLAEPLTRRELEVRLLAAGRSNQRIARDLVALDTVKST
jgi:DNA-binding NarL/FixJ family response regulator